MTIQVVQYVNDVKQWMPYNFFKFEILENFLIDKNHGMVTSFRLTIEK